MCDLIGSHSKTILSYLKQKKQKFSEITSKIFKESKKGNYLHFLAIGAVLVGFAAYSAKAYSKTKEVPNGLPIKDAYTIKLIEMAEKSDNICLTDDPERKKQAEDKAKVLVEKERGAKEKIEKIVKGTPMESMVPYIAKKDKTVSAFLVGIAMKESKFGVYSPKIAGHDCYNYWGFKGGGRTVAGGYTCFNSPEEAVNAVGARLEKMVAKGVRTPAQAISWKCGSSCAGHGAENVRKWIADVGINFFKINS